MGSINSALSPFFTFFAPAFALWFLYLLAGIILGKKKKQTEETFEQIRLEMVKHMIRARSFLKLQDHSFLRSALLKNVSNMSIQKLVMLKNLMMMQLRF